MPKTLREHQAALLSFFEVMFGKFSVDKVYSQQFLLVCL